MIEGEAQGMIVTEGMGKKGILQKTPRQTGVMFRRGKREECHLSQQKSFKVMVNSVKYQRQVKKDKNSEMSLVHSTWEDMSDLKSDEDHRINDKYERGDIQCHTEKKIGFSE